ncbi:hypothetical protein TYRP_001197 [Tyrophagus putrescentiae]|nr:hypothetical protein TYRP_001197 [Tyrophagus putrescentiae]
MVQKLDKAIAEAKREALSSSSVLFQLLKSITPQIIFEKCILPVFIKADLFRSLKTINRPLFYRQQLSTLPHISSGLRRRLLLFKLSADKLFFVFQAFIIFIVLAVYFVYFYSIISQFSKPPILSYYIIVASVLYTFTVAVIYYCLMRMLRCALFFIYCSLLGTLVYTGHLTEIGDRVNRLLQAYSFQTGSFSGYGSLMVFPVTYRPLFTRFLHDHNLICSLVLTGSRDLFGDILFVFLLTNMPINIWLIRRLFVLNQTTIDHLLLWTVISCQSAALAIVFWPLAYCQKVFHSPKKWINLFQLKSKGSVRWLRLKLKYDDLFHRLSTGPKMAISIGPIDAITFGTALEVVQRLHLIISVRFY